MEVEIILAIIGISLTFFGVAITYFGNLILKSRKEIIKDSSSRIINGTLFVSYAILIPVVAIYFIYYVYEKILKVFLQTNKFPLTQAIWILVATVLIVIQFLIFNYYQGRLKKVEGISYLGTIFSSAYLIAIAVLFFLKNDFYYFSVSILFDFLIFTFMASRDPMRNKDNSLEEEFLEITFVDKKEKSLIAKINGLGDEFIDVIPKGKTDIDKNKIALNKSNIFSIKRIK